VHTLMPFGDGKYCNKLAQTDNLHGRAFDVVVLLDTDTIVVSDLRGWVKLNAIGAKIVDCPNPSIETLMTIAERAGVSTGPRCRVDDGSAETFEGNCNGGFYAIPRALSQVLVPEWKQQALWLIDNIALLRETHKEMHVDQVSFWLALRAAGLPFYPTASNANYFIHVDLPHTYLKAEQPIALVHYHNTTLDDLGLLSPVLQDDVADSAIAEANRQFGIDANGRLRRAYLESHGQQGETPSKRSLHRTMVAQSIFGEIRAYTDDLITDQIIDFGAHTRVELAFLLAVVESGDKVFDLGAHIGTFTLPLAQKVGPLGRVIAVEAARETFEILEGNVSRASAKNIEVLKGLIAPSSGAYAAHTADKNTGATYFLPASDSEKPTLSTISIRELCEKFFVPRIVKIDLEGFEAHAFRDAAPLWPAKPIIYAEICRDHIERTGQSVETLDRLFHANGYRFFRNVGDRNAAHDDFVVTELDCLSAGGSFYDLLAIHRDDERIGRITRTP